MTLKKLMPLIGSAVLAVIMMIAAFTGCSAQPQGVADEEYRVELTLATGDAVQAIHMKSFWGEDVCSDCVLQNANETALKKGETLTFDFTEKDFPEGSDPAALQVQFFVQLADGRELPTGDAIACPVQYGKTRSLQLTGNAAEGYAVTAA